MREGSDRIPDADPASAVYTPSGRVGSLAIPAALLWGGGAAVLGAFPYQGVVDFLDSAAFAWVAPVVTLAYAAGIGRATAWALRWGKARSVRVAVAMGLVAGAVGLGLTHDLAWHAYRAREAEEATHALGKASPTERAAPESSASQQALQARLAAVRAMSYPDYVKERMERGWLTRGRGRTRAHLTGWAFFLAWLLEALLLCGGIAFLATFGATAPFCERCEVHAEKRPIGTTEGLNPAAARAAAPRRGILGLLALEEGAGNAHLVWTIRLCPTCARSVYVSATTTWVRRRRTASDQGVGPLPRRDSGRRIRREDLLTHVIPTRTEVEALTRRFPEGMRTLATRPDTRPDGVKGPPPAPPRRRA